MTKRLIVILVYLLGLILLLWLGAWQVQRGLHKQQVEQATKRETKLVQPKQLDNLGWQQLIYQPVSLKGQWLSDQSFHWLGRSHQGRMGVEVLVPFELVNGELIMVNRGWLGEQSLGLEVDPLLDDLNTGAVINGQIYRPTKGVTIGKSIIDNSHWPRESLYLDLEAFAAALQKPLLPYVLVLAEGSSGALKRVWQPVVMSSTKHFGYAVQWFGLAVVFLVFGFIWFRKKS